MTAAHINAISEYKNEQDLIRKLSLLKNVANILAKAYVPYHTFLDPQDLQGEFWFEIPKFPLYWISNFTRVKSKKCQYEKILKPSFNGDKYNCVGLINEARNPVTVPIHRIMGVVFLNLQHGQEINHISGIKLQNIALNLELSSDILNAQHAKALGLAYRGGEYTHNACLSNSSALEIFNSTLTYNQLADKYKVTLSVISDIKIGRKYSSITGEKYEKINGLSNETVLFILNCPGTYKQIAEKFDVSKTTVQCIKNGIRYSEITGVIFKRARPYYRLSDK